MHPSEASHGDLGIIDYSDAVVVISNSGETPEISDLVEYTKRHKIPLITITSNLDSLIAEQSDITLLLPKVKEACPMGLAPTTTTTMTMALGDAMAINLMARRNFNANDFKLRHPGGKLGKQLLKVSDIMHKEEEVPATKKDSLMSDVIIQMTAKSFGCVAVLDERNLLAGIITDGDLRRHMSDKLLQQLAEDVMTPAPKSIRPVALASEAVAVMNELEITSKTGRRNTVDVSAKEKNKLISNNKFSSRNVDKVTLSEPSKAKTKHNTSKAIASEIRHELVNKFRDLLQNGSYEVKANEIADKIVQKIQENKNRLVQ